MTNADKIRSVTDEELARILFTIPHEEIAKSKTSKHIGIDLLDVLEWLKSEAEE